MPDDVVLAMKLDSHSAVVAVTHDPKLDDLALMEALKSPAFYVGALGSRLNPQKRRERLAMFDLSQGELERLHGPIGLAHRQQDPTRNRGVDPCGNDRRASRRGPGKRR